MRIVTLIILSLLCLQAFAQAADMRRVEVRAHNGRPTVFVDGAPLPMAGYCPIGWSKPHFIKGTSRFYPHQMNYYQIMLPAMNSDLFGTQYWEGDTVSNTPLFKSPKVLMQGFDAIDESAEEIIKHDPHAVIVVRMYPAEPQSWKKLHQDEFFLSEDGTYANSASYASDLYWNNAAKFGTSVIQYCESRPWANRIVGYVNLMPCEGVQIASIEGWLYDHNPKMLPRWRAFLKARYQTDDALRAAWGDNTLSLETVAMPKDKLRRTMPEVSRLLYWQAGKDNAPLRDYLAFMRNLFHQRYRQVMTGMRAGTDRARFFVYDMYKQPMQGWNCGDFFDMRESRRLAEPDLMAATGSIGVASLFDAPAFDGLLTPHDYQARGVGGIFEPEGMADSAVLRGKLFLCEMDQRTWADKVNGYGTARNLREYEAISWRNLATALTRGFYFYWMDLSSDWYAPAEIQQAISRQVAVIKESVNWKHETVPGIAVILDDAAALETNGGGNVMNEAVMWEMKQGLARCGVPVRTYLLEDLALPTFPKHAVFYFPNLFKVDDARLALLKDKVFRDGNVVVWGPGSGISDGTTISAANAEKLTGFKMEMIPVNYPHRVLLSDFSHPVTKGVHADTVLGGPLSYGPLLFPLDGQELGLAWTKLGRHNTGLAVKSFGKGARGAYAGKEALGTGDYAAVFTHAMPLPADLWRNLARFGGAHVYSDTGDVLLADSTIVALHALQSGPKTIMLPGSYNVYDVVTGKLFAKKAKQLKFTLQGPETRVFRLEAVGK
jgi:hypothetical protein